MRKQSKKGFSLAELLVALLILAQIATFAIPKILYASQKAHEKAVFKETVAAAQNAVYLSQQLGDFKVGHFACGDSRPEPIDLTLIGARLNPIWKDEDGATKFYHLANGAKVSFYLGGHISINVDVNDSELPNEYGQDKLVFYFTDCAGVKGGLSTGHFGPITGFPVGYVAENTALWEEIFK